MAYHEKKIKFLATKLSSLQAELNVSREIMHQASKDVNEMFNKKYFPEIPPEPEEGSEETGLEDYDEEQQEEEDQPETEPNQEQEQQRVGKEGLNESANKNADPEVKKLFKKIAAVTHPDKIAKLSDYEKSRKEKLFKKAMLAMENNDLILMADIAMELEIETPDLTREMLKETENKIITIKQELHHIESTYVWKWFFCEDETEKESILQTLFGFMYANSPNPGS